MGYDADVAAKDTKLALKRIEIFTGNFKDEYTVEFLKIIKDPANRPVLFHCAHNIMLDGMI